MVAAVWLVHGLYNKLLGGSRAAPGRSSSRCRGSRARPASASSTAVGVAEVAIALWVLSGWRAARCARPRRPSALLSMNVVELTFARHLLLWPAGLIPVNLAFLALAWTAADRAAPLACYAAAPASRSPIAGALPRLPHADLRRPGRRAAAAAAARARARDAAGGYGFVAVALVQTRGAASRGPAGRARAGLLSRRLPRLHDVPAPGRPRGSAACASCAATPNRARMVTGGNLLTHYNYHRCDARVDASRGRPHAASTCATAGSRRRPATDRRPARTRPPPGSPFASVREARRFAGPLPFTFDYEAETHPIIAIQATRDATGSPTPVTVDVERLSFFDQPAFRGCTPVLAAAFHVTGIDYRWERGVRYPLATARRVTHDARSTPDRPLQLAVLRARAAAGDRAAGRSPRLPVAAWIRAAALRRRRARAVFWVARRSSRRGSSTTGRR